MCAGVLIPAVRRAAAEPLETVRGALGEARDRLHTDDGPRGELRQRPGTGVGAGRAHARADAVQYVLDARALRVQPLVL